MELILRNILKDVDYLDIDENIKINVRENNVIFGANGIGKTTIYNELKNKYKDFDYLDYDETKDLFKKNKKKIEISLGINRLEELSNEINKHDEILSVQNRLKQKRITSKQKAQSISVKLGAKYNSKEFSEIKLTESDVTKIKEVDNYLQFIISNYDILKAIDDITDELKLVDQNYLKKALMLIDSKVLSETHICPVCGSTVPNLKSIIQEKIQSLSKIKNECLKRFINLFEHSLEDELIQNEFIKILELVKEIKEENIIDYFILDGNLEMATAINNSIKSKIEMKKELANCLKKQEELFLSLKSQKEMYTGYLYNNFDANVEFNDDNKLITISFSRNVDTFSTGEINIILFITKLFSFIGSEKQLLIIDDPISSYDLVNQYHIAFHLCKIIDKNNKNVLVLTHNPDAINVINSQNNKAYKYLFLDKVNGKIFANQLPETMSNNANVLFVDNIIKDESKEVNKYLSIISKRDDENPDDSLSAILHYDGEIITLGSESKEFEGCTNKFYIDYIENNTYLNDFENTDFENLCRTKILSLTSIRVWIEYKLQNISSVKLHGLYSNKVNSFFKKNKQIQEKYPNLNKETLMNKKVMLNQNCHVNSQVQPFYYALSIKVDDIKSELQELKNAFIEI